MSFLHLLSDYQLFALFYLPLAIIFMTAFFITIYDIFKDRD